MDAVSAWRNRVSDVISGLSRAAGSVTAIIVAVLLVAGYVVWGTLSGFTTWWFSVLHSVTGVTAFVMVFLIAHGQGRESRAMLLKLDELVAATSGASDEVVGVEQHPIERQERLEEDAPVGDGEVSPTPPGGK